MRTTERKKSDILSVMYINWINEDFLRNLGVLKQKLCCLKFLGQCLCLSLLLIENFECNSLCISDLFYTEIWPLELVKQFCLFLQCGGHLSIFPFRQTLA